MLSWPDEGVLRGPKRVQDLDHGGVKRARSDSVRWTQTLICDEWLPTRPDYLRDELVMIRDWEGPLDATFVRWERNGYAVQVSQTPILIAIKLDPLQPAEVAKTPEERRDYARRMYLEALRDTCVLLQPAKKEWTGIHEQILDRSFSRALIKEIPGGVAAVAWSRYVAMMQGARTMRKNGSSSDGRNR